MARSRRQVMYRRLVARSAAVVALVSTFVAAVVGRGSFTHFLVAVPISFWIAQPMLLGLVGFAWWTHARRKRGLAAERQAWGATTCASILMLLAGSAASYWIGLGFGHADIEAAIEFSDALQGRLERHRAAEGAYPQSLDEVIGASEPLPRLFDQADAHYWSDGSKYSIQLAFPTAVLRGTWFDSETSEWKPWS